MFWKKTQKAEEMSPQKAEKLPGPREMPELVGRYLVTELHKNPDWVWGLRGVLRPHDGKGTFDFRIFDKAQVSANKVSIKNYLSLNNHPELILYQGWFDKQTMSVTIEQK